MAKKKGDGALAAAPFIIIALVVLVVLLSAVVAIALLGVWAYRELTYGKRLAETKEAARQGHTGEETLALAALKLRAERIANDEREIKAEGSHLSKRNDGYFQARSDLARNLNSQWEIVRNEAVRVRENIAELESLPEERLWLYVHCRAALFASRAAIALMVPLALVLIWIAPEWIVSTGEFIHEYSLMLPDLSRAFYGAAFVSAWAAAALYFLARWMARQTIPEELHWEEGGDADKILAQD